MKLFFLFILTSTICVGQSNSKIDTNNYLGADVEVIADFPGGTKALMKYLQDSVITKINITKQESYILKTAYTKFVIEGDGKITNVKIIRSSNIVRVDSLFKRAIERMPNWKPTTVNGQTKKQDFNLPLRIELK